MFPSLSSWVCHLSATTSRIQNCDSKGQCFQEYLSDFFQIWFNLIPRLFEIPRVAPRTYLQNLNFENGDFPISFFSWCPETSFFDRPFSKDFSTKLRQSRQDQNTSRGNQSFLNWRLSKSKHKEIGDHNTKIFFISIFLGVSSLGNHLQNKNLWF